MTSKAYVLAGTPINVNGEAGADYAWSMEGLTDGAGRVSAQIDLGAGARPFQYRIDIEAMWQATPTQYQTLDIYAAFAPDSDSTAIDGDVGASDAALGDVNQITNLRRIGSVVIETADTTKMAGSFEFETNARYLSLVGANDGGSSLNATDSNFQCVITPISIQGQDT